MIASAEDIRSHFPALQRRHDGRPVAYFDAPGGTQVPRAVAEAMNDYLFHHNANTHWAYPTSEETDAILFAAREACADLLNARAAEIVFGNNMTSLTFHLARTLGRTWKAGDEVIVTELDHHANVDPWRAIERDFGIVVRVTRMVPETPRGRPRRRERRTTKGLPGSGASWTGLPPPPPPRRPASRRKGVPVPARTAANRSAGPTKHCTSGEMRSFASSGPVWARSTDSRSTARSPASRARRPSPSRCARSTAKRSSADWRPRASS